MSNYVMHSPWCPSECSFYYESNTRIKQYYISSIYEKARNVCYIEDLIWRNKQFIKFARKRCEGSKGQRND